MIFVVNCFVTFMYVACSSATFNIRNKWCEDIKNTFLIDFEENLFLT